MSLEDSVVCLTNSEGGHGTGFIIKRKGHVHFLVTCAHVVSDLGGEDEIKVCGQPVKVFANGAKRGIDLAVLQVELDDELKAFRLEHLKIQKDFPLKIVGHRRDSSKSIYSDRSSFNAYISSEVPSSFGDVRYAKRPSEWTIEIQENSPDLTEGCSGSPAFNDYLKEGFVCAVVRIQEGNRKGRIIPISYLEEICPDLYQERISNVRPKHLKFSKRVLPEKVYFMDHKSFREKFRQALKAHIHHQIKSARPFLCFIPSWGNEDVDLPFIESLKHELEKEKLLCYEHSIDRHFISGLEDFKNDSELCQRIENSLKEKDQTLLGKTEQQSYSTPIIIQTSLTTEDWYRAKGEKFIYEFVHFWSEWPSQNYLFLVLIFFHYKRNVLSTFKNKKIAKELNRLDAHLMENNQISGKVLEEFSSFKQEDIKNWVNELANNYDIYDFKDKKRELNQIRTEIDKFIQDKKNKKLYFMKDLNELYSRLADLVNPIT